MFGTVVLGTILATAVMALPLFFVAGNARDSRDFARKWIGWMFLVNLILNSLIVYFFTPALLGPLAGYQWLWFTFIVDLIVGGALAMFLTDNDNDAAKVSVASAIGSGASLLLVFIFLALTVVFTTWGDGNAKTLAAYPQITVSTDPYPEADPAHTPIVTESIAKYNGAKVLASNGQNLGSAYHPEDYNLMNVSGHLWYVAPLVYNNFFANLSNWESPGLVVVDAEDPNTDAQLKLEHKLHYLPGAIFNQDLVRYLYMNGYSNFKLTDPTLEVDDNWVPYFTVDISTYVTGVTGGKVVGVLVVNSETGEITRYDIGKEPAWIDRVMPGSAVEEYITWWGLWNTAPWINFSGQNTVMPADNHPTLVYNRADGYPAWQFLMTSRSSRDSSSTGVILFDTKSNKGTLYPDTGIAVGSDVTHAFESNPKNLKNYVTEGKALYNIYGNLTWVTTFESPAASDASKSTFQAVGLLDSKEVQGSNVIMETTKEEALRVYQRWLGDHGNNETNPTEVNNVKEIEGYVDRFAFDIQGGNTIYFLTIKDTQGNEVDRIFYGTSVTSEKLPLTLVGDHVIIRYQDVNTRLTAIVLYNDLSITIPLIDPTSGAPIGALPTFTATAAQIPTPTVIPTSLFENTPHP